MEFDKLVKLNFEDKKSLLAEVINNDVSYWKKILMLMAMSEEGEDTELLDLVIENKIREINLANKKYNLNLSNSEVKEAAMSKDYIDVMEQILNNSDDEIFGKACREVLIILKHIPNDYFMAISDKFIERLEAKADKSHSFEIHPNISFEELKVLEKTKDILDIISNKFWKQSGFEVKIEEIFNKVEG